MNMLVFFKAGLLCRGLEMCYDGVTSVYGDFRRLREGIAPLWAAVFVR